MGTGGNGSSGVRGTGGAIAAGVGGRTGTGGAVGNGGITAPSTTGTIVPLYTYPTDASWTAIATAKRAHPSVPVIAIVNPNDGPGTSRDASYTSGIANLQAVGITVIGYVATGYTSRGVPAVEADIDRWKSFYPTLQGIFFDEQSNLTGDEVFYRTVSQYAKAQGLTFTVGNPGTDTGPTYVGVVDVGLIYESKGLPSTSTLGGWHSSFPKSNFGIIPWSCPGCRIHKIGQGAGWLHLRNQRRPPKSLGFPAGVLRRSAGGPGRFWRFEDRQANATEWLPNPCPLDLRSLSSIGQHQRLERDQTENGSRLEHGNPAEPPRTSSVATDRHVGIRRLIHRPVPNPSLFLTPYAEVALRCIRGEAFVLDIADAELIDSDSLISNTASGRPGVAVAAD